MKRKAYIGAQDKLRQAGKKLADMKAAKSFVALADAWSEFLIQIQRVYHKLGNACTSGQSQAWFGRIIHERKTDELLSYVHHARNADEHGIDQITRTKPGGITFMPPPGRNEFIIDHFRTDNQGRIVSIGPKAREALRFFPPSIYLVPVIDKGVTFHPPKNHLGASFPNANIVRVAEAAHLYLGRVLADAQTKFGHEKD